MTAFAIALGIFSYLIFFLGVDHILYPQLVFVVTLVYWIIFLWIYRKNIYHSWSLVNFKHFQHNRLILSLLCALALINLIGALGPEYAFDALWYHLTLPKIYLLQHAIIHIPGGLFYYSDMPKLAETLYIACLSLGNEITAKLLQYIAGLLITYLIYHIARKYISISISLLAAVIFYSNLVVDWESTTAYIDLIRAFFEILALQNFLWWLDKREFRYFSYASILVGLAITTKLIALGSLAIFIFLLLRQKEKIVDKAKKIILFSSICLLIPLPWFVFSFAHTGNPLYPFFTPIYPTHFSISLFSPLRFIHDIFILFIQAADPVIPIYLIAMPITFLLWKQFNNIERVIFLYSVCAIFVWYIIPQTGGGRFIVPYLPALSISIVLTLNKINQTLVYKILVAIIIFLCLTSICYRAVTNIRYIPGILGIQTKTQFLTSHLNFSFGDFYDTDGYFRVHIHSNDKVLLYGFHNLYYVDFPFIDSSWIQKGESFNYIALQDTKLPHRFINWEKIYSNDTTHVELYYNKGKWTAY